MKVELTFPEEFAEKEPKGKRRKGKGTRGMGVWKNTGICVIVAILFYDKGHHVLFWSAVITGIVAFGSHGIMQNYLQRKGYGDLKKISNWLPA